MSKAFKISENSRAPDPYSVLMEYRNRDQRLLFESGTINSLSNSETESTKKNFLKIVDAYGCLGMSLGYSMSLSFVEGCMHVATCI